MEKIRSFIKNSARIELVITILIGDGMEQNGYFESYIFNAYSTLSKPESSIYLPSGENVDFYDNIVYFTVSH